MESMKTDATLGQFATHPAQAATGGRLVGVYGWIGKPGLIPLDIFGPILADLFLIRCSWLDITTLLPCQL